MTDLPNISKQGILPKACRKNLGITASLALAFLCPVPALAGGTAAGTDVANTITASYQVGGLTQTPVSAVDTFKIDRKVIFSVDEAAATGTTFVSPGQIGAVSRFLLTNTSNDVLDFSLGEFNFPSGTVAPHGGSDTFDVESIVAYVDGNDNGIYEPSLDTELYVDNLGPDESRYIFVLVDIPLSVTNGEITAVHLFATARSAIGSPSNLIPLTEATDSTLNSANTVETVFADVDKSGPGGASVARDGVDKARDDYTVRAPTLSVTKTSRILNDYLSTDNPKAVPGALVEYCVTVANAPGAAEATNVSISDVLPAELSYFANSIRVNANVTNPGQECENGSPASDGDGDTDGGAFTALSGTVQGALGNLEGGSTSALIYQATVN